MPHGSTIWFCRHLHPCNPLRDFSEKAEPAAVPSRAQASTAAATAQNQLPLNDSRISGYAVVSTFHFHRLERRRMHRYGTCQVTVNADTTVTATFSVNQYLLSVNKGEPAAVR